MSLWTPYRDDFPLDLSKPKVTEHHLQPQFTYAPLTPPLNYGYCELYVQPTNISPGRSSSGYESVHSPVTPRFDNSFPSSSLKRPFSVVDCDGLSEDEDFQRFKQDALRVMAKRNGGILLANNPRMRRSVRSSTCDPDYAYRRQRDKNNVAAKQSRDKRKLRDIHLSLKVAYLRREVAALKSVMTTQHCSCCRQSCICSSST